MIFMNSNQNVKKPADASKNTQQQDQQKDKTAKKGAQEATGGAKNFEQDREDAQGDDVIGTPHTHINKAMGNAANPGQHQKDNAGNSQHDKNKSHDDQQDKNKPKDGGDHDKHQGSGGGQHKH
jgi:hypothetical protein